MKFILLVSILICISILSCSNEFHNHKEEMSSIVNESSLPKYFYKNFKGDIGGELIILQLIRYDSNLTGYYCFEGKKNAIYIGNDTYIDSSSNISFCVGIPQSESIFFVVGKFKGKFVNPQEIRGIWSNEDSSKNCHFFLCEVYPDGTYQFDLKNKTKIWYLKDSVGRSSISITYPVLKNHPDKDIMDRINTFILNQVYSNLNYGFRDSIHNEINIDKFIETFTKEQRKFNELMKKDAPDYQDMPWLYDLKVSIVLNKDNILSLKDELYTYTGGAHGMYSIFYFNLDMKNGNPIKLGDLIKVDSMNFITNLGLKKIKEKYDLDDNKDLSEAGFFIKDSDLNITDNFCIDINGFIFQYQPYEIASWANGAVNFSLTFDEICNFINANSILSRMLAK